VTNNLVLGRVRDQFADLEQSSLRNDNFLTVVSYVRSKCSKSTHHFVEIKLHIHILRVYGHRRWRRSPRQVSPANASRIRTYTATSPDTLQQAHYRDRFTVAKTHRMPYFQRSLSSKEPYNWWLSCGQRLANHARVSHAFSPPCGPFPFFSGLRTALFWKLIVGFRKFSFWSLSHPNSQLLENTVFFTISF